MPLKNTPYVNEKLRHISHLIDVRPLRFPHGLPETESDYDYADLRPSGNLYIKRELKQYDPETPSAAAEGNKFFMKQKTWDRLLKRQKASYAIHAEYFQADYVYEKNQDGKEYRYATYGYAKKRDS